MSDDKKNSGFWSLTGIAAIVTALGGLIAVFHPTDKPKEPTPIQTNSSTSLLKTKTGDLEVDSKSQSGTPFTNPDDSPVKINFKAENKWAAIPTSEPGNLPKGYLSPDGAINFAANNVQLLCPAFPLGALVVKNQQEQCLKAGAQGSFDLRSRETVYFVMNDVKGRYDDNDGSVTVHWSVVN